MLVFQNFLKFNDEFDVIVFDPTNCTSMLGSLTEFVIFDVDLHFEVKNVVQSCPGNLKNQVILVSY